MSDTAWHKIIGRISPQQPVNVTPDRLRDVETPPVPMPDHVAASPTSAKLWSLPEDLTHIGVRVLEPVENPGPIALRLSAMAAERQVVPIILSSVHISGFEQFGFRVERLPNGSDAMVQAFEDELCAFWDIAMVVDVKDVTAFG